MPLVFLDIESTGLDPSRNVMLELGMIATTNDLEVIGTFRAVLRFKVWENNQIEQIVLDMHAVNGLWAECEVSEQFVGGVEADACDWMKRNDVKASPMAGSNLRFDRSFLKVWMPRLEEQFHYRNADLSSVREFARRWRPELVEPTPKALHRAIPDLHDTLELARFYRDNLFAKA